MDYTQHPAALFVVWPCLRSVYKGHCSMTQHTGPTSQQHNNAPLKTDTEEQRCAWSLISHYTQNLMKCLEYTIKIRSSPRKSRFITPSLCINPLKPELNPTCYLLALLGAHHFLHVSRIRVKLLTLRLLMSYIPFLMFLDHTQRRSTVGRTPLDE